MRIDKRITMLAAMVAGFFLLIATFAQAKAGQNALRDAANGNAAGGVPDPVGATANSMLDSAPEIGASRRISIPYGFLSPLPTRDGGNEVWTGGHGGCTAGEEVTVAVTVTQAASGAQATGESVDTCNGELQRWGAVATVNAGPALAPGLAEACGLATTRDDGSVTDTFDWCVDVELFAPNQQLFLPTSPRS